MDAIILKYIRHVFLVLAIISSLYACVPNDATGSRQQVQRIPVYHVNRGETLYSIAWRFRLDHKQIAWWNEINPPFTIYRGQTLYLAPPPGKSWSPPIKRQLSQQKVVTVQTPVKPAQGSKKREIPGKPAIVRSTPATKPVKKPDKTIQPMKIHIKWGWPLKGKIIGRFERVAGWDIKGKIGQPVVASASGKVVYAGNGIKGYGQLVIIKHNDTFLSAYAYNKKVLVNQGDRVFIGQKIAEMGKAASGEPLLHFEIRKNGDPVDPEKYIRR